VKLTVLTRKISKENFDGHGQDICIRTYNLLIRWMTINISGKTPYLTYNADLSEHDAHLWLQHRQHWALPPHVISICLFPTFVYRSLKTTQICRRKVKRNIYMHCDMSLFVTVGLSCMWRAHVPIMQLLRVVFCFCVIVQTRATGIENAFQERGL
jgi:hypothetical protein